MLGRCLRPFCPINNATLGDAHLRGVGRHGKRVALFLIRFRVDTADDQLLATLCHAAILGIAGVYNVIGFFRNPLSRTVFKG